MIDLPSTLIGVVCTLAPSYYFMRKLDKELKNKEKQVVALNKTFERLKDKSMKESKKELKAFNLILFDGATCLLKNTLKNSLDRSQSFIEIKRVDQKGQGSVLASFSYSESNGLIKEAKLEVYVGDIVETRKLSCINSFRIWANNIPRLIPYNEHPYIFNPWEEDK